MKDINGVELNIGDKVVYLRGKNSDASLATGEITKFYKGYYGDECSVSNHSHITSSRIMKL